MRRRNLLVIPLLAVTALVWLAPSALTADSASHKADEQAIRAAARQYVDALARGDVQVLEALWTPEGDIVDEFGQVTPARDVIEREAKARQANALDDPAASNVKLLGSSIRFLTDDVALEDGTVEVSPPGLPPSRGQFMAVWVRNDKQWRLASLRESRLPTTTADDLAALDWMVGDWTGQVKEVQFDVAAHWNEKHTFLERDLTVTHEGKVMLSGQQHIGVDPLDGKIKSWMHDAEGGHGEGIWTRHGDTWVVHASGVTPDGRRTASTNIYTSLGPDRFSWKSTGGVADGRPMPDFEIELTRAASGAK